MRQSTKNNSNTQKGKNHTRKAKVKANTWTLSKRISLLKQFQPCDPSVVGELTCISSVDPWIMGVTLNSVSSIRRQAGAEYLLLDSGAQLHSCPITCPGQKIPLTDPGIHTASGARLKHDGGRLVTFKLPEGRTIRVLFHACAVRKPILSLGRLTQQGYAPLTRAGVSEEVAQELHMPVGPQILEDVEEPIEIQALPIRS